MRNPLKDATPEVGYQTVEWDMLKAPEERVMPLTHTNRLKLSEMSVRPDRQLTEYSLVDRDGNTYTEDDLEVTPETMDSAEVDALLSTIETSEGKQQRVALAHLAEVVTKAPAEHTDVVDPMVELLTGPPPAIQGEALGILSQTGETKPEVTRPAVERAIELATDSVHPLLQTEALQFLAMVTEHDPAPVTEAVPQLTALLRDDTIDSETVARILASIARVEPDALVDVVPRVELFLETEPGRGHVWALEAVGQMSKEHANITAEVIPTAAELITAEETPLRSNALGVLADLADEYPDKVKPWTSDIIELMEDSDEKVRYNATATLTRIADEYPDVASPATDKLLAVLDDELADTRFNACWALKYINATSAIEKLREIAETDPDADVRSVARLAADSIEN